MVKLTHGFFTITLQIYDYYFFTTSIFYCRISSIFKKLIKEISIMANVFENTWNKLKELTSPQNRGFRLEAGLGAVGAIGLATLAVVFPPIAWPLIITLAGIVAVVAVSAAVVAIGAFISSFFKKEDKKEEQDETLAIEDSQEENKKLGNQEEKKLGNQEEKKLDNQEENIQPQSSSKQIHARLKLEFVEDKLSKVTLQENNLPPETVISDIKKIDVNSDDIAVNDNDNEISSPSIMKA
jgi:hypothetical protein